MNRKVKLFILILLSLSVYIVYQNTSHNEKKVLLIGDSFSKGINSYGIEEYSYTDYYKEYLENNNIKVSVNKEYSSTEQSIFQILDKIKTNPKIKRDLLETNLLIINIGYNDLLYKLSLEKNKSYNNLMIKIREINTSYKELLKEIKKYYKEQVIIIGYYEPNQADYYENLGIRELNKILKKSNEQNFIDLKTLLKEEKKYYLNSNSNYPNRLAYQKIAQEIITKTLEK